MNNVLSSFRQSFSPLSIRNFRIYLGGQAISLIGTWLQVTAQGWVVWELSKSEAALGIVAMLNSLPLLLLSPFAGVWADRLDRRKLLIGTQISAMLLAFVLAFLRQTGNLQLWHVYLMSFFLGAVTAVDMPAQQAFIGDMSGMGQVRQAVNLNAMILQLSRMLGPAFAGMIVSALGAAMAFWLNGISFIAVIISLLLVQAAQIKTAQGMKRETAGNAVGDAVKFIRTNPRIQDLFLFVILMTFLGLSLMNIMPSVASKVLNGDAQTLGLLLAASGAGALVSTLFIVPISQSRRRPGIIIANAILWMGAWFILFAMSKSLPLSMLALFFGSFGAPVVMTTALGLLQFLAPVNMRARLLSLFITVSFGMQPVAALMVGFVAEHLGTATAILINGILLLVGAVFMLVLRPELRTWEVGSPVKQPEAKHNEGFVTNEPEFQTVIAEI